MEGAAERLDVGDGGGEFLGHLVALRLVGGEFDVARSGCGGVEGDADVGGVFLFEDGEQGVDEAVERGGVDAFRVADRRLDQREMGAIDQGHAVEQEKAVHGGRLREARAGSPENVWRAGTWPGGDGGLTPGPRERSIAAMYEASGTIKLINDTQTFPSGFTKREFVVTTAHDKYPQDLKFEVVKDRCAMLDGFEAGQEVQVNFDIRGNEYNGKYFVNLSCWKIQAAEGAGGGSSPPRKTSAPAAEPDLADIRNDDDFDDEVPF